MCFFYSHIKAGFQERCYAKCGTPTLDTEIIKGMFLRAYNEMMGPRDSVIEAFGEMLAVVGDFTALDEQIDSLNEVIQVVAELVSQCIKDNATRQQSQEEYSRKYNGLVKRYEKAVAKLNSITEERTKRADRERELRIFISTLQKQPLILEEWSEELWLTLLDTATVHRDGRITFLFKNGSSVDVR